MIHHYLKSDISVDKRQRNSGCLIVTTEISAENKANTMIDIIKKHFFVGIRNNTLTMNLAGFIITILLPYENQKPACWNNSENEGIFLVIENLFSDFKLPGKRKSQNDQLETGLPGGLTLSAKTFGIKASKQVSRSYSGFAYLSPD